MSGPVPRIYYEVAPSKAGTGWTVSRDGKVVERFCTKATAVDVAIEEARGEAGHGQPTSLRIKGRNGRVQEERTYPRSSDPRRTPG